MKRKFWSIFLLFILICSMLFIIPEEKLILQKAKASSTWKLTNETDFKNGILMNVVVNGTGEGARLELGLETDKWVEMAPADKPQGRYQHAMATIWNDDKVVLFGGASGLDDTWIYDLSDNKWEQKSPTTKPGSRCWHAMAMIYNDDKVLLFGGYSSGIAGYYNDTWVYDLSDDKWEQKFPTGNTPSPRMLHAMATIYNDDKVVLFGGYMKEYYFNDTWVYDLSDDKWEQKFPQYTPVGMSNHAMATVYDDDKVVLYCRFFGGNGTWIYDLSDNQWYEKKLSGGLSSRLAHKMAMIYGEDKVVLFGGYSGGDYFNETWVYDLSEDVWYNKTQAYKPSGRYSHAMATIYNDDKIVLFGGADKTSYYLNDTWLYQFVPDIQSGAFISSPHDTTANSNFLTIHFNATTPQKTELKFQLRTADTKQNLSSKSFVGNDGTINTYYTASGSSIWSGHNRDRWIQYKAYFSTIDLNITPVLYDVTITYNILPNAPTLISPESGIWINSSKPVFIWNFIDNDSLSQSAFQLVISNNSNFTFINYDSKEINSDISSYVPNLLIEDGIWYWKVRTKDSDGGWGPYSSNWVVKIDTKPPYSLSIEINNGALLTTARNVVLNLSAFDNGSGIDKMCFSNDGFIYTPWENFSRIKSWELSSKTGKKTVYFKVKDKVSNEALAVNASIIYDPTADDFTPPEITNINPKDGAVIEEYKPTISANYSDSSGINISSIVLRIDGNKVLVNASPTGLVYFPQEPLSDGEHTVYLEVRDSSYNRNLANKSWKFKIVKPLLAYIIIFPQSATVKIGEKKQFIAKGFDKNDVELGDLNFTWSLIGEIGEIDNNGLFTAKSIGFGKVYAGCKGKKGEADVLVVKPETEIPTAVIDLVSPNPAKEGEEVYFYGHGNSSKKIIGYEWSSSIDDFLSDKAAFVISNLSVGNHTISFRVKDDDGLWSNAVSVKLKVVRKYINRPPVVGIIDIPFKEINFGKEVLIKTSGSIDYDGDALQFFFEFGDGKNSSWVNESEVSHIYEKKGKYILKFRARDSYGAESDWSPEFELEVKEKTIAKKQIYDFLWFFVLLILLAFGGAYIVYRIKKKPIPKPKEEFAVEDVFLIYNKDGRLIQHTTRRLKADMDEDIFAGMLTAVQMFVKDSIGKEEAVELGSMEYGENKILLEKGKHVILAVVISGREPDWLKIEMKDAIKNVEAEYAAVLPSWDGNIGKLAGVKRFLTLLGAKKVVEEIVEEKPKVDVQLAGELEFYEGYVRLKIAAKNNSDAVVTNSLLKLIYNKESLRIDRIEPKYPVENGDILLGNIETKEKKTVAIYLDPQICIESYIDATLTFKDYKGNLEISKMKRKKVAVVCPIMYTDENINIAMLKRMVGDELSQKDAKIFEIPPKLSPKKAFEIGQRAVRHHDVRLVREFIEDKPSFIAESWYYGKIKERKDRVIIRISVREETNTTEFFVASDSTLVLTGLLAELRNDLNKELKNEMKEERTAKQLIDEKMRENIRNKPSLLNKCAEEEVKARDL